MAHQDEGWPLGLRPLNARVGLIRSRDFSAGSVSFSTLVSGSPTSSIAASSSSSSSDLDTESTGSFFHDKSITLGSLLGVSGIIGLSRRSTRRRAVETSKDPNRLFVDGLVAAGQPSSSHRADGGARSNRKLLESGNGFGTPLVSSCLCGQLVK
ncbi:hypothetical protein PRUPE_6G253600 [Prunus persica]|uniref:Uncharacterized protein n=1 Tax=Prunus persica TaxID=3760 RepID=A0A251NVR5_PRUPE|nr:uncharacterized protein LOC18774351 isoform X3 [Prunus persica]ONI03372.1 hypothetical protein PRUPE_6G253600 [Prunus persica]